MHKVAYLILQRVYATYATPQMNTDTALVHVLAEIGVGNGLISDDAILREQSSAYSLCSQVCKGRNL